MQSNEHIGDTNIARDIQITSQQDITTNDPKVHIPRRKYSGDDIKNGTKSKISKKERQEIVESFYTLLNDIHETNWMFDTANYSID